MANILYQKLERQYSDDGGNTWISMNVYKVGDILENPSDCISGGTSTDTQCKQQIQYQYSDYTLIPNATEVSFDTTSVSVTASRDFTATTTNSDCTTTTENGTESNIVFPYSYNPSGINYTSSNRKVTATTQYGTFTYIQKAFSNAPSTSGGTESSGSTSGDTSDSGNTESSGSTCVTSTTYSYGDYILTPSSSIVEYNVIPTVMVSRNFTATTTNSDCSTTTEASNEIIKLDLSPTSTNPSGENPNSTDRTVTATTEYGTYTFIQQGNPNVDSGGTESSGSTSGNGTLAFAWSGSSETQIFKMNNTTYYTASTNPYSATLSELGISNFTSAEKMFSGGTNITTITSIPDTTDVTSMYEMFYRCSSLTSLDVTKTFNTSKVTDMSNMFDYCSGLTSLNVSNWDTSNVTDMYNVFSRCSGLTSLDLSNWDTSNVTSMYAMFSRCTKLTSLDLSNWNMTNVTTMGYMFNNCSSLTTIKVTNCSSNTISKLQSALSNAGYSSTVSNEIITVIH